MESTTQLAKSNMTDTTFTEIALEGVNVKKFREFINDSDVDMKQCIEFENGILESRAHPPSKNFVNYTSIQLNSFVEKHNIPDGIIVRCFFAKLTFLTKVLDLYSSNKVETVNCSIKVKKKGNYYIGTIAAFKAKKLNTSVKCIEDYLVEVVEKQTWQKISDTTQAFISFKLDEGQIGQLQSLNKMYLTSNDTSIFYLKIGPDGISMLSKNDNDWEMKVSDEATYEKEMKFQIDLTLFKFIESKIQLNCAFTTLGSNHILMMTFTNTRKFLIAAKLS